jgi:integrase
MRRCLFLLERRKLLLRIAEAARLLSVSQNAVKRLVASGELLTVRIENVERIPLAALEALIARSVGTIPESVPETLPVLSVQEEPVPEAPAQNARKHRLPRKSSTVGIQNAAPQVPTQRYGRPALSVAANETSQRAKATSVGTPRTHVDIPTIPSAAASVPIAPLVRTARTDSTTALTIADLMAEWLRDVKVRVRPRTYASYAQMTRLHITPELGHLPLAATDIRTIEQFLRDKQGSGLSARTVLYIRAILRQAFQDALRWNWVDRNIIALTRGPKNERPLIEVLPPEEARRLLASFRLHRHGLLFTTALGLGLRFGEVLGLRWKDVTLTDKGAGGQVTVRVQLQKIDRQFVLVPPKSRSGVRTLALPTFVARALRERHRVEQKELLRAGHAWEGGDWGLVFSNQWGTPLDESRVRQRFREHLVEHAFPPMRFHDLRHQCASLLLVQGTAPRAVMEILGHSQISLTMDLYSHVLPCVHKAAANALDEIMQQT